MFDNTEFPKALEEEVFESWLEEGRQSKLSYRILLIVWDEVEATYRPVFAENRDKLNEYQRYAESTGRESLIAAYDLYSESRIS